MLEKKERYEWVNALRGYAVLLVVLIHTSQHWYASEIVHFFSSNGDMGVQLFFLMSAFTLFNSYSKRKNADSGQTKRFFFLRRFFRIAPYYYVAGMIYIVWELGWNHTSVNFPYVVANFLFLNGIYLPAVNYLPPGGWSVGIEMLFYLTIPFLFRMIKSLRHAIGFFVVSIALSVLFNVFAEHYLWGLLGGKSWANARGWEFYFWLPNQLPVFSLGIVLFFLVKETPISPKTSLLVFFLSFVILVSALFASSGNVFLPVVFQRHFVFSIAFFGIALSISTGHSMLNHPLAQKLGVVSFSVYLNHFLVLYIGDYVKYRVTNFLHAKLQVPNWVWDNDVFFVFIFVSIVAITYKISTQTYKYIESPGMHFAETIIKRIRKGNPS